MKDDTNDLLNDLLIQWHRWATGYRYSADINSSPTFREFKAYRGWETLDEIAEEDTSTQEAVQLAVMGDCGGFGAMEPPSYRTALQLQARNLHTGRSVWTSARLPQDLEQRAQILGLARVELLRRLHAAGVL